MTATQDKLKQAWRLFPTGVTLINTRTPDGGVNSMTANSVTSVSLDPPLVLVCVGHQRNTYRYIAQEGRFCINFLSQGQRDLAAYFARDPKERKGNVRASYGYTESGAPVVEGCLASLDCSVEASFEAGDHTIYVGRVTAIQVREGEPLVWYKSSFTRVEEPTGSG